jgi:hypothetical protein
MKVRMEDGRIVEMTRAEMTRLVREGLGRKIRHEAGIRPTDSPVMVRLKCAAYTAAQTGRID